MTPFRIAIDGIVRPEHLPVLAGIEYGWFSDGGLDVELVSFASSREALAAVAEGTVEAAVTGPAELLLGLADGLSLQGFVRLFHSNGGVLTLNDSGIQRPADLAGRRIQAGPLGKAIIASFVGMDDGDPSGIQFVDSGVSGVSALSREIVDAVVLATVHDDVVKAHLRGLSPRLLALKDYSVPDLCQKVLVARPSFLSEKVDEVSVFVHCIRRGIDSAKEHALDAGGLWARVVEGGASELHQAQVAASVAHFTYDLGMSSDFYIALGTWLLEVDVVELIPDIDECWTNTFVY